MDDITRKRLEQESAHTASAMANALPVIGEVAAASPEHDNQLVKIGIPADADAGLALTMFTFPLGNMAAAGVPIEFVRAAFEAVAQVEETASYDVCVSEAVADAIENVANKALGGAAEAMFYTWARLMRNGFAEIVFVLEDYYFDIKEHPLDRLREIARTACRFMIDSGYPIYLEVAKAQQPPQVS